MRSEYTPPEATPAPVLEVLPPPNPQTLFLGGIFLILFLAVIKIASVIVIPMVMAFVLKMVLQPVQRFFEKLYIPRVIASMAIVVLLLGTFITFGMALSGPASEWLNEVPRSIPKLQEKLGEISRPMEDAQKVMEQAEHLTTTSKEKVTAVKLQGDRLSDKLFAGTQSFVAGVFTTMLILFFLMVSGDTFLRRLVEMVPRFRDKRQMVDISQQIEEDVTIYLQTITLMNLLVGILAGLIMWACGVGDPVLWGSLAFILNYIPVLGPVTCMVVFTTVGLLATADFYAALLPVGLYFIVHFIEGTLVTPLLLARRFTLNPVLVILSVVFWYWMWGFVGSILAVPMLAMTKLLCDRIERLKPIGHFFGTEKTVASGSAA